MEFLNAFMPIWEELRGIVEAAIPLLMKAALFYLGIRFALVISSVIIRLARFNTPPRSPHEMAHPAIDPEGEISEIIPGGNAPPANPAALPESTSDNK